MSITYTVSEKFYISHHLQIYEQSCSSCNGAFPDHISPLKGELLHSHRVVHVYIHKAYCNLTLIVLAVQRHNSIEQCCEHSFQNTVLVSTEIRELLIANLFQVICLQSCKANGAMCGTLRMLLSTEGRAVPHYFVFGEHNRVFASMDLNPYVLTTSWIIGRRLVLEKKHPLSQIKISNKDCYSISVYKACPDYIKSKKE